MPEKNLRKRIKIFSSFSQYPGGSIFCYMQPILIKKPAPSLNQGLLSRKNIAFSIFLCYNCGTFSRLK